MNSNALRYFVAVARAGSFRRAGDILHVAASAVNRQVSLLEQELQTPLFERRRGRTTLRVTAAGEVLLKRASTAMKELEQARAEIHALKGLQAGTVNFGAAETFSTDFLPGFLAEFNRAYPNISFRITMGLSPQLVRMLVQDEIELALVFNPPPHHEVQLALKFRIRAYAMLRRDHPLAKRRSLRLADCLHYPIVMPEIDTSIRAAYDEMFARCKMAPSSVITTNSYEMLRSAASVGLGIAIVNRYVANTVAIGDAIFVPLRDPLVAPQLLACCVRAGRNLPVASVKFLDELKSALRSALSK